VADRDNGRILTLSPTGAVLASWGREGSVAGQLKYPEVFAESLDGLLYIADRGNDRIQVCTRESAPAWSVRGRDQFRAHDHTLGVVVQQR
jgi:hypothetical protein